jgi:hypothetical protein
MPKWELRLQHSDKPRKEFSQAREFYDAMKVASSMPELEQAWIHYLRQLDRVWDKAKAHYSRSPKWHSWNGKYRNSRQKDPLICYLVQARNVEAHAIEEITEKRDSFTGIGPAIHGQAMTATIMVGARGEVAYFKSDVPARIEFSPARVILLPVTNHNVTYQPPKSHLGKPVDPNDIIAIAGYGLEFYDDFLRAAEEYFVD